VQENPLDRRLRTLRIFVQTKNESIVINGGIVVTVLDILDDDVILAVDAPAWVEVGAKELLAESEAIPVRPR
jgi:sRNA-binding carbon storage regulator CsrA